MRFTLASALVLAATATAAEIPSGTHLLLRMQNSVTTRTAKAGDYVYMQTGSPVSVDNTIAVPVGSHVQGVVTYAKRSGKVKGRAELAIRLETLTLPGGRQLRMQPRLASVESDANGQKVADDEENRVKQASSVGKDVGQVAIYAGSGAVLGALINRSATGGSGALRGAGIGAGAGAAVGLATAMLTRGREVELRQGSSLDVVFDKPVTIE